MLSLVHQKAQILFFRAAPIYSVPRQYFFMGYSTSSLSYIPYLYYIYTYTYTTKHKIQNTTKKQCCYKTFLSYSPYLSHLNYFWYLACDNISKILCGYWHLKTGKERWREGGKKEGRESGRERGWCFGLNTQEQRQHPVEIQLAFQAQYTHADFDKKWKLVDRTLNW